MARLATVVAMVAACSTPMESTSSESDLVHGNDDRHDVFAHPDERLRSLAKRSIVALVENDKIDRNDPNDIRFDASTLGETRELCEGETFANDPAIAHCSGTLIADDLVLTAAHCLSGLECGHLSFVFGLYRDGPDSLNTIREQDVFGCAGIHHVDGLPAYDEPRDVAVVKLDRPATAFDPVAVSTSDGPIADGTPLATIGFPWGAPAKIESAGSVTDPRENELDHFVTNQDIFRGNSGSGVFHRDTLELVGVVIEFNKVSEETVEEGGCNKLAVVDEDRGTTHVAYARHVPGFGSCAGHGDTHLPGFHVGGMLPNMSACASDITTLPVVMSAPNDISWRFAPVDDLGECGGNLRVTPSSAELATCVYTQCFGGVPATDLSCDGGQSTLGPHGQPGCCSIDGTALDLEVTCSEGQQGMFLHMMAMTPSLNESCSQHELSLAF